MHICINLQYRVTLGLCNKLLMTSFGLMSCLPDLAWQVVEAWKNWHSKLSKVAEISHLGQQKFLAGSPVHAVQLTWTATASPCSTRTCSPRASTSDPRGRSASKGTKWNFHCQSDLLTFTQLLLAFHLTLLC